MNGENSASTNEPNAQDGARPTQAEIAKLGGEELRRRIEPTSEIINSFSDKFFEAWYHKPDKSPSLLPPLQDHNPASWTISSDPLIEDRTEPASSDEELFDKNIVDRQPTPEKDALERWKIFSKDKDGNPLELVRNNVIVFDLSHVVSDQIFKTFREMPKSERPAELDPILALPAFSTGKEPTKELIAAFAAVSKDISSIVESGEIDETLDQIHNRVEAEGIKYDRLFDYRGDARKHISQPEADRLKKTAMARSYIEAAFTVAQTVSMAAADSDQATDLREAFETLDKERVFTLAALGLPGVVVGSFPSRGLVVKGGLFTRDDDGKLHVQESFKELLKKNRKETTDDLKSRFGAAQLDEADVIQVSDDKERIAMLAKMAEGKKDLRIRDEANARTPLAEAGCPAAYYGSKNGPIRVVVDMMKSKLGMVKE
jgi:hypothetical protein